MNRRQTTALALLALLLCLLLCGASLDAIDLAHLSPLSLCLGLVAITLFPIPMSPLVQRLPIPGRRLRRRGPPSR
jgi:hypothetical protein